MTKATQHNSAQQVRHSGFYIGKVFHKRFVPKRHQFTYPLYMMFIDLDEAGLLDKQHWWFSCKRWAPLQLKASDYFKTIPAAMINSKVTSADQSNTTHPLKSSAITIAIALGAETAAINRVAMLAQLRCFGLYFSPVNFFFLYQDSTPRYLLAEVSNTPWNQKYCYLVDLENPQATTKAFHVSPFMTLDMEYRWKIQPPASGTRIQISNWQQQQLFTALFTAKRYEISSGFYRVLWQWPVVTLSVLKGIYWQAAKLFVKGIPYVPYKTAKTSNK